MADNRKNNKKQKNIKRFIFARPIDSYGFDDKGRLYMQMIYVLDTGNLISDVQKKLQTKTICIHNYNYEYEDKIYKRCIRARNKLQKDLEFQICATGAIQYNAEIIAKKLMKKMRY